MSFEYKVIINDTKPTNQEKGVLWLHKTSGILFINIDDFRQMAASMSSFSTEDDNIQWITAIESSSEPASPILCQIWIKDNKQVFVYLDKWIQIVGAV